MYIQTVVHLQKMAKCAVDHGGSFKMIFQTQSRCSVDVSSLFDTLRTISKLCGMPGMPRCTSNIFNFSDVFRPFSTTLCCCHWHTVVLWGAAAASGDAEAPQLRDGEFVTCFQGQGGRCTWCTCQLFSDHMWSQHVLTSSKRLLSGLPEDQLQNEAFLPLAVFPCSGCLLLLVCSCNLRSFSRFFVSCFPFFSYLFLLWG